MLLFWSLTAEARLSAWLRVRAVDTWNHCAKLEIILGP